MFLIVLGIGIACFVCSIIFRKTDDFVALLVCGIVTTVVGGMFILIYYLCGAFTPIYLTENGIKKRNNTIEWENVKITLYPLRGGRGFYCCYFMIVDRQYITDLPTLKSAIKHGISIRLSKKALDMILPYCQSKLFVLDSCGDCANMKSSHNINLRIEEFNSNMQG